MPTPSRWVKPVLDENGQPTGEFTSQWAVDFTAVPRCAENLWGDSLLEELSAVIPGIEQEQFLG